MCHEQDVAVFKVVVGRAKELSHRVGTEAVVMRQVSESQVQKVPEHAGKAADPEQEGLQETLKRQLPDDSADF